MNEDLASIRREFLDQEVFIYVFQSFLIRLEAFLLKYTNKYSEVKLGWVFVCARVRELQLTGHIEDSGIRRETPYGKTAIVWQKKDQI